MTTRKSFLISAVVLTPLVGLVAWRTTKPHGPKAAPHFAVVPDLSWSTLGACQSAGGLVKRVLTFPEADKHSTLLVLATGDNATLGEPIEIIRLPAFRSVTAMESPSAAERRNRELVASVIDKCSALPRTSVTPLYLAIRRTVEQLKAVGCGPTSGCKILLQTDGEETVEVGIRRALAGSQAMLNLPAPIDNTGIAVTICGLSETTGQGDAAKSWSPRRNHNARSADRVVAVWRRLFTAPDLITFEPVCPKAEARTPNMVAKTAPGASR